MIHAAIQIVATILLMMSIGAFVQWRGWVDDRGQKLLSNLVINIALPCSIVNNLTSSFDRASLLSSLGGLIVPFASISFCYLLGWGLSRLLRLPQRRRGIFINLVALSNTVFIGMPICTALFGDAAVPSVLVYYMVNTLSFWTFGVNLIRRDGDPGCRLFSLRSLKNALNAPLVAFFASLLLVFGGISLPVFLKDTFSYVGSMVTPLSMLFVGIVLGRMRLRRPRYEKGAAAVLVCRFLVSPAVSLLLSLALGLPALARNVFTLQAGMPTMTQLNIVSRLYNSDSDFAAVMTAATTLLSLAMIPLYAAVLPLIG